MSERLSDGPGRHAWVMIAGLGLVAAVIGWTDFTLVFVPWSFGSPEWEFGTISAAVDGMPLGTLGLSLFTAAGIGAGWRVAPRIGAILALVVALVVGACMVTFALDVPLAIRAMPAAQRPALDRAVIKTGLFCVSYLAYYLWFGVHTLRRLGATRKGSTA